MHIIWGLIIEIISIAFSLKFLNIKDEDSFLKGYLMSAIAIAISLLIIVFF